MAEEGIILGIGAPAVDFIVKADSEFLKRIPGELGGMELVKNEMLQQFKSYGEGVVKVSLGGCSLNKLKGLARLGHKCRFVGMVGEDEDSEIIREGFNGYGIEGHLVTSKSSTAQVVCLIDEYGHRTFRTDPGASSEMRGVHLSKEMFEGVSWVIIEGYLLANRDLIPQAIMMTKEAGAQFSFDLACLEYCRDYKKEIAAVLQEKPKVLFANSNEVKAILETNPYNACEKLRKIVEIAVVTMSDEGCWVGDKDICVHCPAFPVRQPFDTTGAGDLFASGFLHGLMSSMSLERSAEYGALIANEVVRIGGTDIPEGIWNSIQLRFAR